MPNEQLVSHIRSELSRGVDKTILTQSLMDAGWQPQDVHAAMNAALINSTLPIQPQVIPSPPPPVSTPVVREISPIQTMVQNTASGLFIACVAILTVVSILGVWRIFDKDVITKSFETLGLLAFVSIIVIIASKFVGTWGEAASSPAFRPIRNITLGTLIVSSVLLAFFGIMAIWDIITDKGVLNKSLSSLAIIAFSSFIIVLVCLQREQESVLKKKISGPGAIVAFVILIWIFFSFALRF